MEQILQLLVWWNPPKTQQINSKPHEGKKKNRADFCPERCWRCEVFRWKKWAVWGSEALRQLTEGYVSSVKAAASKIKVRPPNIKDEEVKTRWKYTKRSRGVNKWSDWFLCGKQNQMLKLAEFMTPVNLLLSSLQLHLRQTVLVVHVKKTCLLFMTHKGRDQYFHCEHFFLSLN